MRIERLDLTAFGHFTDHVLELDGSGLQVIFGPNEAGKTTARAAIANLLFGIEMRTTFDFVHRKPNMRLGAKVIDDAGNPLEVIRYKRRNDDLVDATTDLPVSAGRWAEILGGRSEEDYLSLYTLGREELVDCTKDLLRSGGSVEATVFAAGLGRTSMGEVLDGLTSEAAGLYRPRGKLQTVNERLLAANAARDDVRRLTVLPTSYERIRKEHGHAVEQHRSLIEQRTELRAERDRLLTLRAVLPVLVERATVVGERDALEAGGTVEPGSWGERVQVAIGRRAELEGERAAAERRVAIQDEKLAGIAVDKSILERAERIRSFAERIGAYETDTQDRAGLEKGRRQAEQAANALLEVLGDGHSTEVSSDEVGTIIAGRVAFAPARDRWNAARARVESASEAVETMSGELEEVNAYLAGFGPKVDLEPLRANLAATRAQGDLDERVATARSNLEGDRRALAQMAGRLKLDADHVAEALARPSPSEEEVAGITRTVAGLEAAAGNQLTRAKEFDDRRRELTASLTSFDVAGTAPSEEEITERRGARDETWRSVRTAWLEHSPITGEGLVWGSDADLAATYEERTHRADEAADRMWREAERAQERRNLVSGIEGAADQEQDARDEAQRLKTEARSTYETWRERWPASATSEDPDGLRAWLGLMSDLRTVYARSSAQEQEAERLIETRRTHRDALGAILTGLGAAVVAGDLLDAVVLQAQAELERLDRRAAERAAAEDRKRVVALELPKLTEALEADRRDEQEAADALRERLGSFGTGITGPEAALSIITQLDELAGHLAEVSDRSRRIAGIDRRCEDFLAELDSFWQAAPDIPHDPPGDCARALVASATAAESAEQTRRALLDVRESAVGELEEAVTGLAAVDGELIRLAADAGISDPSHLGPAADRSVNVSKTDERLNDLDQQLAQQAPGRTVEELITALAERDAPTLDAEVHQSSEAIAALDESIAAASDAERDLGRQLAEMDGSAAAADALERTNLALSEAVEAGGVCARLLLARYLADEAIRRFAAANQDPIITVGSRYLREVTAGRYEAVGTEEDGDGVQLTVRAADGVERQLGELSTGVGDQLWFSLRLAAIEEAVCHQGALPVVVDDILVNFDDERTLAALHALAELGNSTQVLLFTHHTRVFELARNSLGPGLAGTRTLTGN
ncbi:MAG: AAA family ATPase [Acidimicrobiales bacterium]